MPTQYEWMGNSYSQEFKRLRIADLARLSYARVIANNHKIFSEGFAHVKCDPPAVVCRRDGSHLIDGAHRCAGARMNGVTHLECRVITGDMPDEHMARLSYELQMHNRKLSQLEAVDYRYVSGDPLTRKVVDLVRKCGYDFKDAAGSRRIRAYAATEKAFLEDDGRSLETYLRLAREVPSWADDPGAVKGHLIHGVVRALRRGVPVEVARTIMRDHSPQWVLNEAGMLAIRSRGGNMTGQGARNHVAEVIWGKYEECLSPRDRRRLGGLSVAASVSAEAA